MQFLGQTVLRLVSTVHPNETERNTNLMHYASIFEKYSEWRRNYESMEHVSPNAAEYRYALICASHLRQFNFSYLSFLLSEYPFQQTSS